MNGHGARAMKLSVRRWREVLPTASSWSRLLVAPSSYLFVIALVATMAAKWVAVRRIEDTDFHLARWLAICDVDIAVFLGLACACALVESRRAWLAVVTTPIASLFAIVALLDAGYLAITGEQLSWAVVSLGIERFGDVQSILGASIPILATHVLVALVVLAIPLGTVVLLRRRGHSTKLRDTAPHRARAAGLPALLALVVLFAIPTPDEYGIAKLAHNAVLRTFRGMITGAGTLRDERGLFAGYKPPELVTAEARAALRTGVHPNIVVVILESTRRDVTTLARADAPAKTPALVELAARGLDMTHARAVMTLTSKSISSMLCGRLPLMQRQLYENTDALDVECLPRLFADTGWRTLFIQSAEGTFEDRPRLVDHLGFAEFLAMNHISGKLLGYVSSEEATLVAPIAAWIDREPQKPFFLTVLTSATHHPYSLSDDQLRVAREAGLPAEKDFDRYVRQLENADRMIASVVQLLRDRGQLDNTIIAVLGDHGQGFGDKVTMQHGANFYEEGLRVPFVIAGPGVPHRRVTSNTMVADLTPTLLRALGVTMHSAIETPATVTTDEPLPDRILPFTCSYDMKCRGYVRNTTKVVYVPETQQSFAFDLAVDPEERRPLPVEGELATTLDRVHELLARYRTKTWLRRRDTMSRYPMWSCPASRPCSPIAPIGP
ncbi:MAG: sulfatase-like hydrolase/transferase [Kofleriaceae bacterium]